ncbi:MAG TPA: nucleotidyltransferase domain-containing protein [Blastocatellia bacterium]|nr:nucleotidyltransferase domain-containing protein [Blastocatellia bacterium]
MLEPLDRETTDRFLGAVVQALKACNPEKIILCGSVSRGEADEFSDFNPVIIKKPEKRIVQGLVEAAHYVKWLPAVDLSVYTPEEFRAMIEEENPFIERVQREGHVLYEKSD